MHRRFSVLLVTALLLAGCSCGSHADDPLLVDAPSCREVKKLCEAYIAGSPSESSSLPLSMQSGTQERRKLMAQMVGQARQYADKHYGRLEGFEVERVDYTPRHPFYAEAFVQFRYADGAKRTVRVPLVFREGQWWLR